MKNRNKGQSQQTASAKAGISVRSAHRIDRGKTKSQTKTRAGRTRKDPLEKYKNKIQKKYKRQTLIKELI